MMESGLKRLLIIIGIMILGATIFTLVRGCGSKKKYQEKIEMLETALEKWEKEYQQFLPTKKGETIIVPLRTLKQAGFIEEKFVNPKDRMNFSNQLLMQIEKTDKGYQYTVFDKDENMIKDYETVNKKAPMVIMKGEKITHAELNYPYEDAGYEAITLNGKKPDESKIEITTEGKNVAYIDTSKARTYQLTYHISYAKEESTISRIVVVKDLEKPSIKMERLTLKTNEVKNVNLMNGVVVTDNANEELKVQIEGDLAAIPGRYVLTYRVKDSAGNQTEKKRVVRVEE